VGEVSTMRVLCKDDRKTYVTVDIDLNDVQVQVSDDHTNKIELTDDMGVIMKYPSIDSFAEGGIDDITPSNMIEVVANCIAQIYDKGGEDVYDAKDSTKKEKVEFIEQMNTKQFAEMQAFFDTMPSLKHTFTVKNPKTKVESEVTLSGLNDFFE
jgi:hypothetical protein